jgi:hypothetical protein
MSICSFCEIAISMSMDINLEKFYSVILDFNPLQRQFDKSLNY